MQLRSEIQLKSMIKAMQDVVIPALDDRNRLAVEQAQLVTGMLGLMQHQMPLQYRFDRDELKRLIETLEGCRLLCEQDAGLSSHLEQHKRLIAESRVVLEGSKVDPDGLQQAVRALRFRIGELVSLANEHASEGTRIQIEKNVLAASGAQLLRDRALLAPQKWEPDPAALPNIESLLSQGESS
tara:strand:- start:19412 stop:19960 length:549 start_codon:yes stop_codon:yes gene_type:complete